MRKTLSLILIQLLPLLTLQSESRLLQTETPQPSAKRVQKLYKLTLKDNLKNKEHKGALFFEVQKDGTNNGTLILYEENVYPSKIRALSLKFNKKDYTKIEGNLISFNFKAKDYTLVSKITPGRKGLEQDKDVEMSLKFKNSESLEDENSFIKSIADNLECKSTKNLFDLKVVEFKEYNFSVNLLLSIVVFCIYAIFCGPLAILIYGCCYMKSQKPDTKKAYDGFSGVSSLAFGVFSLIYIITGGFNFGRTLAVFNTIAILLVQCRRGEFEILKKRK